ncbi:MAG: sigma-54-dependent Fis family transcriptional regulator [Burkholderiaceae bacterium]
MLPAPRRRDVAIAPYGGNELPARVGARAVHDELIEQSHQRCAALGLSRIEHPDHSPMLRSDLSIARERNQRLSTHAAPVMEMLFEQIVNTESMIVLTDATGTILYSVGDHDFLARADKVALAPGANWAEHSKGTNAIGTALFEERETLVHGGEHFMHANSFLTCSAAPIFDPRGNMLGVLDVTGDQHSYHRHTMGLVRMSARMIENHWLSDDYANRLRLHFHSRVEFIGTLLEGIVVVGADGRILGANRSALDQLSSGAMQLRAHTLTSLFGTTIAAVYDHFHTPLPMPMRLAGPGGQQFHVDARLSPAARPTFFGGSRSELHAGGTQTAAAPTRGAAKAALPGAVGDAAVEVPAPNGLNVLLTGDAQIAAAVGKVRRTLNHDIPLLLLGETGTGKELFARAVHQESQRARQPFVAVKLSALPLSQIDIELFGCLDNADGARRKGTTGRIVQANGGTLFLDEIGALPADVQLRLLGVLQDRCVTPLGGQHPIAVDLAIVCASRRDLRHMIQAQTFREDLYYRLNGLVLRLPALRERSDLRLLTQRILQHESPHAPPEISPSVMDMFRRYAWPGNVRQLANVLRTAALMCADERLVTEAHLSDDFLEDVGRVPPALCATRPPSGTQALSQAPEAPASEPEPAVTVPLSTSGAVADATLEAVEGRLIQDVMAQVDGNISAAAKRLGISRNTVYRKLRRLASTIDINPNPRTLR